MKKTIVFTIAVCLIISLAGCDFGHLDEVKTRHAIYTDDTCSEIEFRDKTYTKYDGEIAYKLCDAYCPAYGIVTGKDVPLILVENEGIEFEYDWSFNILRVEDGGVYLRSDLFEHYKNVFENGELTQHGIIKGVSDGFIIVPVSDEMEKAISETFSGEPIDEDVHDLQRCDIVLCDETNTVYKKAFNIYRKIRGVSDPVELWEYYFEKGGKYYKVDSKYQNTVIDTISKDIPEELMPDLEYGSHSM